ncbi:nucleotide exchange factor GrpE [Roseiterribacter gracilis]|uniref:Protein GrpE n=1 Tax=Roseiterribacter gracilis TaxID=2812848 RepID=A0A8S8XIL6_9PROT|nr:protein GrpE [Rhodospirillales bacterium TMPK1]
MSDQTNEPAQETAPADTLSSPDRPSEGQPTAPSVGEDMAARVAAAEAEAASLKDKLLRALAETENVRRRSEREREDTAKFAVRKFAGDLLNVADNLRRALEAAPAGQVADAGMKNLLGGIEATERELFAAFDRAGIKPVAAQGAVFDPNVHEAMVELVADDVPPGTVVQVFQNGWTISDRLLRPARVGVAKAATERERIVDTKA